MPVLGSVVEWRGKDNPTSTNHTLTPTFVYDLYFIFVRDQEVNFICNRRVETWACFNSLTAANDECTVSRGGGKALRRD